MISNIKRTWDGRGYDRHVQPRKIWLVGVDPVGDGYPVIAATIN